MFQAHPVSRLWFAVSDAHQGLKNALQKELIGSSWQRCKVVGVFPSSESYLRLVTCYLIEYTEDWTSGRSYIKKESLDEQKYVLLEGVA